MTETSDIRARLQHLVSLDRPENGGPYGGLAARECVRAMSDADARIAALEAEVERLKGAAVLGWNACRKSVYAVCEDMIDREYDPASAVPLRGLPTPAQESHAKGFYAGGKDAAKRIARAFNSLEAMDDDNLTAVLSESQLAQREG